MRDKLNTIEEALEDIKQGKVVIVVDDEDRENEGDFVAAAEMATPEMINFMATHGRGLICTPITETRAKELNLELMVGKNTDPHETAFTVSVDFNGAGNTTGISAHDRANTVRALVEQSTKPTDFNRPGHIFPLKAKNGGVLRRTGHTEASIDLARLAGLKPAGVIVEIMNEDGTMARLPQLYKIAHKFDLKIISIEDLIAYRMENESLIEKVFSTTLDHNGDKFELHVFNQTTTGERHVAVTKGTWEKGEEVLIRVHSSYLRGDILKSTQISAGPEIYAALSMIENADKGVVIYMQQENSNTVLNRKQRKEGIDAVDAKLQKMKMDPRDYGVGAQILNSLGVQKMKLMSNHPKKRTGMVGYGLEVTEFVPLKEKA
ncbi:3,4-dihydroxy-2-butanone-4-phosphate synthase [Salibacter sp.]|uniref:3,4-dihydroxy-2-butanone-4-phosphate synthase n=1 Tax=Salibacter sp. TaxID=2010995 RepID=UPI0028709A96|nr:3,4-dihydroxy-2-butanone-4-phosphate synthase [Salibacter sp.]MDR9398093.1 3,4-dihydroxy-2-butanone-4-phosphate synthase [Salibacter sp.]MDR9487271.1 3,4-dihydroxy-2-butanone-4-phosphate synthase [Salibacter sp.]